MTDSDKVWDAGLQPERTGLAWQRLALAFLGLGLALPKLAWSVLGAWSFLPSMLVLAGAVAIFRAARLRYHHTHLTLTRNNGHLKDGRLQFLAAVTSVTLALVGLVLCVLSVRF